MSDAAHPPVPKAALYYYPSSIWCSVALLALEEKGYGADEVDLKAVDLGKGENFAPSYLRINPKATVPTLVVPLQKTLSPEIESRYKAIQDTKAIVEFLDKSRSTQSRTHTTSSAPSPALSPATIAFSAASNKIVDLLHSEAADPGALTYMNARDEGALKVLARARLPLLAARRDALERLLEDNEQAKIRVSEKTRHFWEVRKTATEKTLQVYADAEKETSALDEAGKARRKEFFESAKAAWRGLKEVFALLTQEMIGPYVLGDQLSIADLHLAAWLARLAALSGGTVSEDGNTIVRKVEEHVGGGFKLPVDFLVSEARRRAGVVVSETESTEEQSRMAAFWDAVRERGSFKKVYGEGLH
ncbi:hypothetical protein SCP_0108590 [Sparassis crispa]|uniref:GST N-terminal domain-containing protein n=1 Tax=Sparassis crispa TaxID=139825 RepID=A0A401G751_9APHY|nr:hypothetical protein SCP_0108590 [Sparassis crispa]GBE77977.1 hypothetical protein SCP_0108590 [Sparassis crispa]